MKICKSIMLFLSIPILIIIFFISPSYCLSPQEIARLAFQSVVLLTMEDIKGQSVFIGSGFFVRPNIVATNFHVISEARNVSTKLINQNIKNSVSGVVGIDESLDIVLLFIEGVEEKYLALGNNEEVQIGDEIYAIGNPLGFEGTFSKGNVSAIREVGQQKIFQITAPISPGSSGGPVMNNQGKVIGISFATIQGAQNLNFAIPVSSITKLLSSPSKMIPLGSIKKTETGLGSLGKPGVDGVKINWEGYLTWWGKQAKIVSIAENNLYNDLELGILNFSIHNKLKEPVKDIHWIIVWFDGNKIPSDTQKGLTRGPILPGLAERIRLRTPDELMSHLRRFQLASPKMKESWHSGVTRDQFKEKYEYFFHPPDAYLGGPEIRLIDWKFAD